MMKTVQNFIKTINGRKHVLKLIDEIDLTIHLSSKEQAVFIWLHNGKVFLTDTVQQNKQCEIVGAEEAIIALLSGTKQLRTLMKCGELRVSTNFRTILLLDALFYLGKQRSQQLR